MYCLALGQAQHLVLMMPAVKVYPKKGEEATTMEWGKIRLMSAMGILDHDKVPTHWKVSIALMKM